MDNPKKIITKFDLLGSITNEVIKESSGWMVKKYAAASRFKNTPLLPLRDLGGGTAPLSPFRRELNSIETPCLPFSGGIENPALRPKEHTPLEPSLICVPEEGHKSDKSGSIPGFARGQALLELMSVGLQSSFHLENLIRPDPNSAFHTVFSSTSLRILRSLFLRFILPFDFFGSIFYLYISPWKIHLHQGKSK